MSIGSPLSVRLAIEPLRSLAFGSIGAGYTAIGTAVSHVLRQVLIQNLTNTIVVFSIDGINDHFVLPAGGFLLDDVTSNSSVSQGLFISYGTTLYVKQVGAPTTGSVYFTAVYAAGTD